MALNVQYQAVDAAEQARLLSQLLRVAVVRQRLLAELVEHDPGAVLRIAIPAHLRASLPPALHPYVEEEVVLTGELEVLHEDRDRDSRFLYFLESAGKRFSLHFAAESPTLLSGSRVRVIGLRLKEALALASGQTSVQALASIAPNTFGAQSTLVILVNFQDKATQPYTIDYARNVVFTTTSNFFLENSYQQTGLAGDAVGWYTIPLSYTVCDSSKLAASAKQAASAAGVNLSAYKRYVYGFPNNACTWWGLGSVGGNPSQAWVNGSFQLRVVGHELGHNLGLYHSHSLDCGSTTLGTNCTTSDYGDTLDIMGSSSGHFNAFQKERLGWLDYGASPPITTVSAGDAPSARPGSGGATAPALSR